VPSKSSYHARLEYHVRYQNQFLSMLPLVSGARILECGAGNGDLVYWIKNMYTDIRMEYTSTLVSLLRPRV
jgi:ubiquinone/menaquinone biosynthesis C-methylase UbiE